MSSSSPQSSNADENQQLTPNNNNRNSMRSTGSMSISPASSMSRFSLMSSSSTTDALERALQLSNEQDEVSSNAKQEIIQTHRHVPLVESYTPITPNSPRSTDYFRGASRKDSMGIPFVNYPPSQHSYSHAQVNEQQIQSLDLGRIVTPPQSSTTPMSMASTSSASTLYYFCPSAFYTLPEELLFMIIEYLRIFDALQLSRVSKSLHHLILHHFPDFLRQYFIDLAFPLEMIQLYEYEYSKEMQQPGFHYMDSECWRQLYQDFCIERWKYTYIDPYRRLRLRKQWTATLPQLSSTVDSTEQQNTTSSTDSNTTTATSASQKTPPPPLLQEVPPSDQTDKKSVLPARSLGSPTEAATPIDVNIILTHCHPVHFASQRLMDAIHNQSFLKGTACADSQSSSFTSSSPSSRRVSSNRLDNMVQFTEYIECPYSGKKENSRITIWKTFDGWMDVFKRQQVSRSPQNNAELYLVEQNAESKDKCSSVRSDLFPLTSKSALVDFMQEGFVITFVVDLHNPMELPQLTSCLKKMRAVSESHFVILLVGLYDCRYKIVLTHSKMIQIAKKYNALYVGIEEQQQAPSLVPVIASKLFYESVRFDLAMEQTAGERKQKSCVIQ